MLFYLTCWHTFLSWFNWLSPEETTVYIFTINMSLLIHPNFSRISGQLIKKSGNCYHYYFSCEQIILCIKAGCTIFCFCATFYYENISEPWCCSVWQVLLYHKHPQSILDTQILTTAQNVDWSTAKNSPWPMHSFFLCEYYCLLEISDPFKMKLDLCDPFSLCNEWTYCIQVNKKTYLLTLHSSR